MHGFAMLEAIQRVRQELSRVAHVCNAVLDPLAE